MGFDTFNVGPELEYFLFKDSRSTEVLDEGGYFDLTTLDAGSDVRRETVLALEQLGIHVEYTHHEVGPSQHEIDMRYADAMKMADDCMTYRITVKEYAMKYGWHATFMPKPLFGENGSGMHTHQSLFADGKNAFYDPDDQYFLSDVGKAFIAGQLKHAREICSIFAQWVNSYKRLVPGFEAPVYVAWSRRNRSALVRVPLYHPGREKATRMELRCPDPACNPYLTFAVLLQAGLEGIEKGYELPEPMEKNLYHLSGEERRRLGVEQLPESLGEAIEMTAESELVLRTLGEHMFNRYVEIKRQEWDDYRVQVTQWELDRYLSISVARAPRRRSGARGTRRQCSACSRCPNALGWRGAISRSSASTPSAWRSYSASPVSCDRRSRPIAALEEPAGGDRRVLEVLAPRDQRFAVGGGREEAAVLGVGEARDQRVGERAPRTNQRSSQVASNSTISASSRKAWSSR